MSQPTDRRDADDSRIPLGSPYGPQPRGTDESAGGADSSPFETVPTDEHEADEKDEGAAKK